MLNLIYVFYKFDEQQEHCLCRLGLLCDQKSLHSIIDLQNGRLSIHDGLLELVFLTLTRRIMKNFYIFLQITLLIFLHKLLWKHYNNEDKEEINLFEHRFGYHLGYSFLFHFYTILKSLDSLS